MDLLLCCPFQLFSASQIQASIAGPQAEGSTAAAVSWDFDAEGTPSKGGVLCFGLEKPSLLILVRYLLLVKKLNSEMAAQWSQIRFAVTFSSMHVITTAVLWQYSKHTVTDLISVLYCLLPVTAWYLLMCAFRAHVLVCCAFQVIDEISKDNLVPSFPSDISTQFPRKTQPFCLGMFPCGRVAG